MFHNSVTVIERGEKQNTILSGPIIRVGQATRMPPAIVTYTAANVPGFEFYNNGKVAAFSDNKYYLTYKQKISGSEDYVMRWVSGLTKSEFLGCILSKEGCNFHLVPFREWCLFNLV